jgi:hypothetical protein
MMYDGLCNPGKGLIIDQPGCLSMCPALNVPGSSVKSSLNIEYALCRIKKMESYKWENSNLQLPAILFKINLFISYHNYVLLDNRIFACEQGSLIFQICFYLI